jgi:hypothetical protein
VQSPPACGLNLCLGQLPGAESVSEAAIATLAAILTVRTHLLRVRFVHPRTCGSTPPDWAALSRLNQRQHVACI